MSNRHEKQAVSRNVDAPSSRSASSSSTTANAERSQTQRPQARQCSLRQLGNRWSAAPVVNSATSAASIPPTIAAVAAAGAPNRADRHERNESTSVQVLAASACHTQIGPSSQHVRKEGWTHVSTDLTTPGRRPSERSLHAAAVVNDSMYVFGGYDGVNRVNDFYEFHFPSRSWREILTINTQSEGVATRADLGQGEGQQQRARGATVTATGKVPSPRDRHAAVVYQSSFYIFGGFDGTSRVSDLYGFDVETLAWREVRPRIISANNATGETGTTLNGGENSLAGQPIQPQPNPVLAGANERIETSQQIHPSPSPRHSHAAVVYKNFMYVFGGYDGSYRSDFHEFNFDQSTWAPVVASGRSPRARYRSTACVRGDTMVLFGGHDGTRHLADVHVFDFVNQVWSLLVADGVPPLSRDSHVSVVYRDSMYVFGGSTGSAMNDLYELNFQATPVDTCPEGGHNPEGGWALAPAGQDNIVATSAKWRQIPLVSGGIAVHRFCHVGVIYRGSLYIFGGYDGSSRLNDFVKYDLAADSICDTGIPPSTLLSDLRTFLDDEDIMSFADITLMVEDVPVRAHKLMLMRCPYFRAMLLGDMLESSQSVVNLEIVRHPIFCLVLEYLYTDTVAISLDSAMELFVAADCFDLPRLQAMCERRLLVAMTVENAATIFLAADVHSAASLRDKALAYISSHFELVSKTPSFENMARSNVELVFEILKVC